MEPNNNEFTNRDEVFFVEYHGIIKDPNQYMLYLIHNDLYDTYKDFVNNEDYKGRPLENFLPISSAMPNRNFFATILTKELDVVKAYKDLYDWDDEMISKCEELSYVDTIRKTMTADFCKKIYIYSPERDERIERDLFETFGPSHKITYCYGVLEEILEAIPMELTAVFLSDIDKLNSFKEYKNIDYTEFYIANHPYNNYIDENNITQSLIHEYKNLFEDKIVKIHGFNPMMYKNKHFESIIEPVVERLNNLKQEKHKDREDSL